MFNKHQPVEITGNLVVHHPVKPDTVEEPSPFTVVGAVLMDEHGNRYRPDGSLVFSPEEPGREF